MTGSLFMIIGRSLRRHALSTTVTVLSAALASGLVMAVFSISLQSSKAFSGGRVGFDAVLGARGSKLQLVMNAVYHLDTSPGNIPWSYYERIKADPRVKLAIPYAVGDNYRGYRIVGTTTELFTDFEYQAGKRFEIISPGIVFDAGRREAVLGATAARELGLRLNDDFHPTHGVSGGPNAKDHHEHYKVVGIMKPTNSPSDRVMWIPIEGTYHMEGHKGRNEHGEEVDASTQHGVPDEFREMSAVMLKLRSGQSAISLNYEYAQKHKDTTLAWPIAQEMAGLMRKLGWVNKILELIAYMVVVVAAGSLLASLYNTMNERRREFAILRALGARRSTVFGVIVLEASTIAALGALVGFAVYYGILVVAAGIIESRTGVVLDLALMHPALYWTPLCMVGVGAFAGLLPAFKAYSTDVAGNLS